MPPAAAVSVPLLPMSPIVAPTLIIVPGDSRVDALEMGIDGDDMANTVDQAVVKHDETPEQELKDVERCSSKLLGFVEDGVAVGL